MIILKIYSLFMIGETIINTLIKEYKGNKCLKIGVNNIGTVPIFIYIILSQKGSKTWNKWMAHGELLEDIVFLLKQDKV